MDEKKLRWNSLSALVYQAIAILVGLILPRLVLLKYGSEVNGLTYSISQMLSIVTYFDFGVSAVAQAALYKPLHERNNEEISIVYCAIKRYFKILTYILLIYICILCIYYGKTQNHKFSAGYTTTLVLAISVSSVAQYVWGISNQVLLSADQKIYICTCINIFTNILNAFVVYLLISKNQSIQTVKLFSSIIFMIKPIFFQVYVKKRYKIEKIKPIPPNAIKDQWSGLVQHIAITLTSSLDTIVLTLVSNLNNISIYNVYAFPLNGVRVLIESVSGSYKSFFGHVLVKKKKDEINKQFAEFELLFHILGVIFFSVAFKLLVPFVLIYTRNVNDTNYNHRMFAIILLLAYFFMILRIPYTTIIAAAGQFRETQMYAIIEVCINIIMSVSLVYRYGLVGVAVGTCFAIIYRTFALVFYLSKYILYRSPMFFLKLSLVDFLTIGSFVIITHNINVKWNDYFEWGIGGILYSILSIVLSLFFYGVFYKESKEIILAKMFKIMKK